MNNISRYRSVFNSVSSETAAYNNPLFHAYVIYGFLSSYPDFSSISHWHKNLAFIPINYTAKLLLRKSLSALLGSNSSIASITYEYGFNGAAFADVISPGDISVSYLSR